MNALQAPGEMGQLALWIAAGCITAFLHVVFKEKDLKISLNDFVHLVLLVFLWPLPFVVGLLSTAKLLLEKLAYQSKS